MRIVYNPNALSMYRGSLTFQWHTKCRGWTISLHRIVLSANVSRSHHAPLRAKLIMSALRSRHSEKSDLRSNVVGQKDRKQSQEAFISIYGSSICRLLESIHPVCYVLLGQREGQSEKCMAFCSITSLKNGPVLTGFTRFDTASVIQLLTALPQPWWIATTSAPFLGKDTRPSLSPLSINTTQEKRWAVTHRCHSAVEQITGYFVTYWPASRTALLNSQILRLRQCQEKADPVQ